jgi:hypothetical protein
LLGLTILTDLPDRAEVETCGTPMIGPLINVHKAMMATQRNSMIHLDFTSTSYRA